MTDAEIERWVQAGRDAWCAGADMPPMPSDKDADTPEAMFWVGFMWERGRDYFKRQRMALYPDSVVPRP